jgi:phosphoglycerol transferase MdoB-like AlkP superfamily enzyme
MVEKPSPRAKHLLFSLLIQLAFLSGGLALLFFVGRLFYLFDYYAILISEPYSVSEIFKILVSASRFDSSIAATFFAPLFLITAATPLFAKIDKAKKYFCFVFFIYACSIFFISWLTILADHYFYVYFKDHFNVFFWEFWENLSNAKLVTEGISDVVPLFSSLTLLIIGWLLSAVYIWRVVNFAPAFLNKPSLKSTLTGRGYFVITTSSLFLLALLQRSTFDPRPLTLQDRRIVLSRNTIINLLHTNVFFPLFRGYQDKQELAKFSAKDEASEEQVKADFESAKSIVPHSSVKKVTLGSKNDSYYYLSQTLTPVWPKYLVRRPKHIVLIFMESYGRWLLDYKDGGLGQQVGSTFNSLKSRGIYFTRHFSPAGGTIKNIASAIFSFPLTRNFYPSIVYHPQGYKNFPGRLPQVMKKIGYNTRFFYGGVIAWHRLYQFLPQVGFDHVYAEHSDPLLPRRESGLYDGDLFKMLDNNLSALPKESHPTFSFVMTLSNHPPFDVPPEAQEPPITLPKSISNILIDTPEQLRRRLVAFRYADHALGKYLEDAAKKPYFKDTLFVITGDHSFSSGIGFGAEWGWKMEQIPLLLYSPDLIKPQYQGQERHGFTTHLDLMPTLASLGSGTNPKDLENLQDLHTWGKNILADDDLPTDDIINQYFSCYQRYCFKDGQLFHLEDDEFFKIAESTPENMLRLKNIKQRDDAYFGSGMHYFFRFRGKTLQKGR